MPKLTVPTAKKVQWLLQHRGLWDNPLATAELRRLEEKDITRLRMIGSMMLSEGLYSPNTRPIDVAIGLPRLLRMARKWAEADITNEIVARKLRA